MVSILPLTLSAAEVQVRGAHLLGPIDLELSGGGVTVLLGPNGAGKTTLLRLMHGIQRVSKGNMHWATSRSEADLRQAYVFQSPILLRRTVLENAAYPLTIRGAPRNEARSKAGKMLDEVGLSGHMEQRAHALSGGEKQKLALARALVMKPEVLFLDEPTASLDGRSTREIETILTRVRDNGTKLVMATHDLGQAKRLAGDVLFLLNGTLHESGAADKFFESPQTPEAQGFLRGDIVE